MRPLSDMVTRGRVFMPGLGSAGVFIVNRDLLEGSVSSCCRCRHHCSEGLRSSDCICMRMHMQCSATTGSDPQNDSAMSLWC